MVISVDIDVNHLAKLGKKFLWPKPSACPACGGGLWWHGFAAAYLSCFVEVVFLRRLYCPHCFSVHRLRPQSHWSRFQTPVKTIEQTISHREHQGRWHPDYPRPRLRQWWYRLRKKVKLCFGMSFPGLLSEAFTLLRMAGAIPVSSVMQCGNAPSSSPPYRSVSLNSAA